MSQNAFPENFFFQNIRSCLMVHYSLSDLARVPLDSLPSACPSQRVSQVGYGVRHGNPGMLRRDLVNMRACAAAAALHGEARHVSERCPPCMYLGGVPLPHSLKVEVPNECCLIPHI